MRIKKKILGLLSILSLSFGALALGSLPVNAEDTAASEFKMYNGAAVRLATVAETQQGNPINGVRFSSYITQAYYENLLATYPNAEITLQSTVSKVVDEASSAPSPFTYEWDLTEAVSFDDKGIATFYHTINFKNLTAEQLQMANSFELEADFWIEVGENGETAIIQADNAGEVDVTRSMRQVAYMAYTTPSTETNPNPTYHSKKLLNYFSMGENSEAAYDLDVNAKTVESVAGKTVEKAYAVSGSTITDVTGKTLADVFTTEDASVGETKKLLFFDESNTATAVETKFVTKIIDTVTEAEAFFLTTSSATTDTALTGYYLLGKDLSFSANLYKDRYFINGTFDGNGHTLTVAMGTDHYVGLFGRISNVTVKNIELTITRDFSNKTSSAVQRASVLGYQSTNANTFENVQLNLSRAEGDTDANYCSSVGYPQLYLIGSTEKSTARNLVVNIADDTLIYDYETAKSINIIGFTTTTNCYMFSDQYALMKKNDAAWGTFASSITDAFENEADFGALTRSKYWTADTENQTLTFGKVIEIPDDEPVYTDFDPVVRFVVTSDVHIRQYNVMGGVNQLEKVFDSAYSFAESEKYNDGYDRLDGFFVVGDLTSYDVDSEYPLFFNTANQLTQEGTFMRAVMGNHEFSELVYSGNGNSWSNPDTIEEATNKFLAASGYENEDYHAVLNGYHFIFLSMDRYGKSSGTANEYLSQEKLAWLKTQLDIAVADDPFGDKPIFVFQHVHVQNTVGGSSGADKYLRELLDSYPNVVDFSGHTHRPVTDPHSIWQDTFTAINTGSMAYLSSPIYEAGKVIHAVNDKGEWSASEAEHAARDGGLYYICEVNADNVMRIYVYDTFTDSVYGEPIYLDSFGDPSGFDYTDEREANSVAPVFQETDEITVTNNLFNRTDISFPQATGTDVVAYYRVEVYQDNQLIKTEYRLSGCQYGNAMPKTMQITLAGLAPDTAYQIKIYGINYWDKVSEPLIKEFTTAPETQTAAPDVVSLRFSETGATDLLGNKVTAKNNATVVFDEELNAYVASFDGSSAYNCANLADWYTSMKAGFTVEAYVKITQAPASGKKYALLANNDDGGFGLYYTSEGKYQFGCYCNGDKIAYATADGNIGEWVHVVGVYDGSALKLYLNGELAATTSVSETYMPARLLSNFLMVGADPYYVNEAMEYAIKGKMAAVNMYAYALTDEQVLASYQAII